MENKIVVPETRGGKTKYDFNNFEIGETRTHTNTTTGRVLGSAKSYSNLRNLNWKFRCYKMNGIIHIVRIK